MTWWKKLLGLESSPGAGSGRGGAMGTPGPIPDEAPPAVGQEANDVVSGGGVVDTGDGSRAQRAVQTPPSAPD